MSTSQKWVIAVFSAGLLLSCAAACGGIGWVVWKKNAKPPEKVYPWAECGVCVKYLEGKTGDPSSIQIISWDKRTSLENYSVFAGGTKNFPVDTMMIEFSYRAKNAMGGMSVYRAYLQATASKCYGGEAVISTSGVVIHFRD